MRASRVLRCALAGLLVAALLCLGVMPALAAPPPPPSRTLGCRPADRAALESHLDRAALTRLQALALPAAADWSAGLPAPGDQRDQGSCVGWATGYAYKTYQESVERAWGVDVPAHQFSPAYIYNQIGLGRYGGAYIADAFDLLVKQGCDTLDSFPYDDDDWVTQPTAAQRQRAGQFRALRWATIAYGGWSEPLDVELIKAALQVGPVVIGTWVYWGTGWDLSGDIDRRDVGPFAPRAGGHAVCVVGYDDAHPTGDGPGAFRFINSWGTGWGHDGYGWMSYEYMRWETFEAEQMWDLTMTLLLSPASVQVAVGQRARVVASAAYSNETRQDVSTKSTWSTGDPAVASAAAGYVSGVTPGEATVTCSYGYRDATCEVRVVPPPPRLLRASSTLQGVRLGWSPPAATPAPDGYLAFMGESSRGPFALIADVTSWSGSPPNCEVTRDNCAAAGLTLTAGRSYYFQVRAYNGVPPDDAYISAAGNTASAIAGPKPPPPPASLTAKTTATGVFLSWRPPSGYIVAERLSVFISAGSAGPYTLVSDVTSWEGSTISLDLTPPDFAGTGFDFAAGNRYYFRVFSHAADPYTGADLQSSPAFASAPAGPLPPPAPTSLSARTAANGVALTWRAPRSSVTAEGYVVYISARSSGVYTPAATVTSWAGTYPNYVVTAADLAGTGLVFAPSTYYYFRVYSYITNPFTGEKLLSTRVVRTSARSGAAVGVAAAW